jgi:hypothetical protein
MNERIRELANEAGLLVHNPNDVPTKLEKFAQLIVRECAAEADKQTIYCRGIPWGKWVKQHFGVEE